MAYRAQNPAADDLLVAAGRCIAVPEVSVMREFDLNIERVLENWTVAHALREVIANALDEQALTETRDPEISATPMAAGTSATGAAGSATST